MVLVFGLGLGSSGREAYVVLDVSTATELMTTDLRRYWYLKPLFAPSGAQSSTLCLRFAIQLDWYPSEGRLISAPSDPYQPSTEFKPPLPDISLPLLFFPFH